MSFPKRDATHWRSASWRDSDAGYAGGRFAMDVNAIWVPQALEATATILESLRALGLGPAALDSIAPGIGQTALGEYSRDAGSLRRAVERWRGAKRHFEVTLSPAEIRDRVRARLEALPAKERRFWETVAKTDGSDRDSLRFLVLSLDADGKPIPVVNTDPATALFLEPAASAQDVRLDLAPIMRPYPVGLFVEGLGPLVANDAYAPGRVWEAFEKDQYHSPRVVWGREVNLLLGGLANQISAARAGSASRDTLEAALQRTLGAVERLGPPAQRAVELPDRR